MKIYVAQELKSAYKLEGNALQFATISQDNVFDTDAFDDVDQDLVGSEPCTFMGKETTFSDVYDFITKSLNQ